MWGLCRAKKNFFFLDIFRENWKFRQSPDFTRSQIWGLSCVPGSKPSSVLESWQNLLSSKVWVNPLLSTFRPSKLAPKFFLGFFPDFFSKKNFGANFEGLNMLRPKMTQSILESKFCQLPKTLFGFANITWENLRFEFFHFFGRSSVTTWYNPEIFSALITPR